MGSKTRLSSYCTKRANNGVNLVMSRKINTRLARPIRCKMIFKSFQNTSTSSGGGGVCGGTQETSDVAAEPPAAPQRDYSQYGGLLGPPRPGDVIAYKVSYSYSC